MAHDIPHSKKQIIDFLTDRQVKYESHSFDSGCVMIDLWHKKDFFVIQLEPEGIGLSLVNQPDFSSIPDEWHYDLEKFLEKMAFLLKENKNSN